MPEDTKPPHQFFQSVPTSVVGALLLAAGVVALWDPFALGWPRLEVLKAIADAFVVAGLLALVVDPFLKGRLYREVSQSTFKFLVGFAQPPEIQEELRKLAFEAMVYARDLRMDFKLTEDRGLVKVTITASVKVMNPTKEPINYEPKLAFEEAENPSVDSIATVFRGETKHWKGGLKIDKKSPRVLVHGSNTFTLKPSDSISVIYKYSVRLPKDFFYAYYFGTRTIDLIVDVDGPGFEVCLDSEETPVKNHAVREYRGLFKIGDHVTIRWRPTGSSLH